MQVKLAVIGLGNVGRRFLELLEKKRAHLGEHYDLEFLVTAVADSGGGATYFRGLDIPQILDIKNSKQGIASYPDYGQPGLTPADLARTTDADVLIELSPTNLKDGEPGLSAIREALARKRHVVTANKGPLVLAFEELYDLAYDEGVELLHSATVTGGLPTLNVGRRDLAQCEILKFEGIVNATTNYILSQMGEGQSYEEALKHAQEVGHAETDPSLDVDGWDAANKLVIIANAVLHRPTKLSDLAVEGIRGVTPEELEAAKADGQVIKLVARAEKNGEDYEFSVKPTRLERSHPLASVGSESMGVVYHTDINGIIFAAIEERDPYPTAAAVLRDVLTIYT